MAERVAEMPLVSVNSFISQKYISWLFCSIGNFGNFKGNFQLKVHVCSNLVIVKSLWLE